MSDIGAFVDWSVVMSERIGACKADRFDLVAYGVADASGPQVDVAAQ